MTRSLRRALLCAVLAAGVLGSLLVAPATTAAPAAAASRPHVGDCHTLTYAESAASSEPDPAVACSRKHTSRTIRVVDVPQRTAMDDLEAVTALAYRACSPALARALGRSAATRAMSAYDFAYFLPTAAQIRAGARWVRCDVALYGGRSLRPLPTDDSPALGRAPHPDRIARCGLLRGGALLTTVCSSKHTHRAMGVRHLRGKRYPGSRRMYAIAKAHCPDTAESRDWYATWPSEVGWRSGGLRSMVCFARTRR